MPSDIFPLETNKRIDRRSACQLSPHLTNASATVTSSSSLPLSMLYPLRSVSRTSYNSYYNLYHFQEAVPETLSGDSDDPDF